MKPGLSEIVRVKNLPARSSRSLQRKDDPVLAVDPLLDTVGLVQLIVRAEVIAASAEGSVRSGIGQMHVRDDELIGIGVRQYRLFSLGCLGDAAEVGVGRVVGSAPVVVPAGEERADNNHDHRNNGDRAENHADRRTAGLGACRFSVVAAAIVVARTRGRAIRLECRIDDRCQRQSGGPGPDQIAIAAEEAGVGDVHAVFGDPDDDEHRQEGRHTDRDGSIEL